MPSLLRQSDLESAAGAFFSVEPKRFTLNKITATQVRGFLTHERLAVRIAGVLDICLGTSITVCSYVTITFIPFTTRCEER